MKRILFVLVFFLVLIFVVTGCKKNKPQEAEKIISAWNQEDGNIAIVYGLGYNEKAFLDESISLLQQKYGLINEGGLIWPIVFPEDFTQKGSKPGVYLLPDILKEKKLCGLIVLGSPENIHLYLGRIRDSILENKETLYPVFSLFSQDDILGTEANSDLVIDFSRNELENLGEETGLSNLSDVPSILLNVVDGMLSYLTETQSGKKNLEIVTSFMKDKWTVTQFRDAETGLKSYNHFILNKAQENKNE